MLIFYLDLIIKYNNSLNFLLVWIVFILVCINNID